MTTPDVSFVMPCYNEQDVVPYTIPQLVQAFERGGHRWSWSRATTAAPIARARSSADSSRKGLPVVYHRVEVNEGYGNGVLKSIPVCSAPWIGIIPADGQVDAEDVVRLFEVVKHTDGLVLGKVRRRFRMDGLLRKVVSVGYNVFVFCLWPAPGFDRRQRQSQDHPSRRPRRRWICARSEWFLDPEIMVKAHYLGVRVLEMNVFARMRGNGLSHVRPATCWEFFTGLLSFKFGGALRAWRRSHPAPVIGSSAVSPASSGLSRTG